MMENKKPTFQKGRRKGGRGYLRALPLLLIVAILAVLFAFGLNHHVSFETLRDYRESLTAFVAAHGFVAALLFIAVYAAATVTSLPGGAILTITGGFLFGLVPGTIYAVLGATVGATGLFLAARTALGDPFRARAGPWLHRMEAGFRRNALPYLLFLRLIPVFPFWLVNLVPAFLGVPLRTYVLGTVIGIIPGGLVYASVGNGLGAVFDRGETPDLAVIFEPEILLPIVGLAVLSLLPVAYGRLRTQKEAGKDG